MVAVALTISYGLMQRVPNATEIETGKSFLSFVEGGDITVLSQSLAGKPTIVEIKNGHISMVKEASYEEILSLVVAFLQQYSKIVIVDAANTDVAELLKDSIYDYNDYVYLLSDDTLAWIGFRQDNQGLLSALILRYPDSPESSTTDTTNPNEDSNDLSNTSSSSLVPTPYLLYGGYNYYHLKAGQSLSTEMAFIGQNGVVEGTECSFTLTSLLTDGTTNTISQKLILQDGNAAVPVELYPGRHSYQVDCVFLDQPYTKTGVVAIKEIPLTYCDTQVFNLGEAISTQEGLFAELVGTWRGCAFAPFGDGIAFGVEITFNSDGSYSSRNYDTEINNGNFSEYTYSHPAFYYDRDGEFPWKQYTLYNFNQNNETEGDIQITEYTTDKLSRLKISVDGQRLMFDFTHLNSSTITYKLEKVLE